MKIINQLSIKYKMYLLVALMVVAVLFLSLVSNNGFNTLRYEMGGLIYSTQIERYANKLMLEEQKYRLNANGSVYNVIAANQAFEKALRDVDKIYLILNRLSEQSGSDLSRTRIHKIREETDKYKDLYLKSVSLLNGLNKQANRLEYEGEAITVQIQRYVAAKRVEIKKNLDQKTIQKINNGSNIWQYTYVMRLDEKKYRLSPDGAVYDTFKKNYAFMMSEWARLKENSNQAFEFKQLEKFHYSAQKYEQAMQLWVQLNKQLVTKVLPKMQQLEHGIISRVIQSAESSVKHIAKKRNSIALTLMIVSVVTILLGVLFGASIARSISSVVTSFQNGLLNFFQYLNQQQKTVQPIEVKGTDEIAVMARVVNENITKIQNVFNRKTDYQQALLEWSKVDYLDDTFTIHKATELSAKALHVERVSIWLFNDEQTTLSCVDLYLSDKNKHESGHVVLKQDYPAYFKAISNGEILLASRAREDIRSCEFTQHCFEPLDVYSILDLPIVQDHRTVGVIRHEKTGEIKEWAPDEQDFASSVVSAISLSLEIKKRQRVQDELEAQKEILHYHAHHDRLTDLPNRFLFDDRLEQSIKQAQRSHTKIAVLFLDLDHFKGVNDSMGHKAGDELLIEVAKRLRLKIRQTDTLARLGGDEFAIVLDQVNNNDIIMNVTQGLLKVLDEPIEILGKSLYVTLSIGVAIYPDDGDGAEQLLKNADAAMYHAKDDGRNTYQFYTRAMTEKAFERIAMEASFRKALSREEFVVYYQPQVDAQTGEYIGVEGLVRWQHPDMGLISPAKFLSFAYETGLIIPLDEWVMKTAMTQFASWQQAGFNPGILALNLSMVQLKNENFVNTLQELMVETGCQPQWLELEVTEGQIMQDSSLAIQILEQIKALGISLAIDDFGTGYSSLSQLKRLPINKLKIDQSFIRDLPDDADDVMISKSIIALAKNMGLTVIAEGVETTTQKDFLLSNGCRYIQGFLYSKPKPAFDIGQQIKVANQ